MHQNKAGAPLERITIDIAGSFPESDEGNRYLLFAMDCFAKWPVYAIRKQEASTVVDALVTNFFCRFGIPMQLHNDQGRNFQSRLMKEVLERLRLNKARTTQLHPQTYRMVKRFVKTIEKHLRKVVSTHQRDWDERLPIFLLAYWASTHETTGVTPTNMVFGRKLRLLCDLMFWSPPDKGQSTTDYAAVLVERLHVFQHFARQHRIQRNSRAKMMVVHPDRLALYLEASRVE